MNHVIDRAIIFSESDKLRITDFMPTMDVSDVPLQSISHPMLTFDEDSKHQDMRSARLRVESSLITSAMMKLNGNKKKVAEYLGISRSYLYKRLNEL